MTLFGYKKLISFVMIFAVALATGFLVGKIYIDKTSSPSLSGTEASYREDEKVVVKLVEDSKSKTVLDFNGIELYLIAEYNLNHKDLFLRECLGYVETKPGGTLPMRSQKVKSGNWFSYYKISPSMSVLGIQTPQVCSRIRYNYKTKATDIVENENGKIGAGLNKDSNPEELVATFPSKGDAYTDEAYAAIFQTAPTSTLNYIVSEKTSKDCVSAVRDNQDGTYSFDINYIAKDGVIDSAFCYSYEIKFSSGYSIPSWTSVDMTVTVNSNFDFVSISYLEKYSISSPSLPVVPKITDTFVDHFYFDADEINARVIPDFKTFAEVK